MNFLLDTHALLWFCEGNSALSNSARLAIEDKSSQRFVSHATAWEVAIKLSLGKLKLAVPYELLFPGVLAANGLNALAPRFDHYLALLKLPDVHRDPFDRLLIAQAQVENLTLITCDAQIRAYGVPVLW